MQLVYLQGIIHACNAIFSESDWLTTIVVSTCVQLLHAKVDQVSDARLTKYSSNAM